MLFWAKPNKPKASGFETDFKESLELAEMAIAMVGFLQSGEHTENNVTSFMPYCSTLISFSPDSPLTKYLRLTIFPILN